MAVSGFSRCSASKSALGTFSGTLRRPSISSEKQISRVAMSGANIEKAWRTIEVRTTSPNVPICGRPLAPYPVSKIASWAPLFSMRASTFRASSKGHALLCSANSRIFMHRPDTIFCNLSGHGLKSIHNGSEKKYRFFLRQACALLITES